MPRTKNCCYKDCKNDSRSSHKEYMEGIFFTPFPKPKTKRDQCLRWIKACGRPDFLTIDNITNNRYVCSEHFVGGSGPTVEFPDPMVYDPVNYMIDPRLDLVSTTNDCVSTSTRENTKTNESMESDGSDGSHANVMDIQKDLSPTGPISTSYLAAGSQTQILEDSFSNLQDVFKMFSEFQFNNTGQAVNWMVTKSPNGSTLHFYSTRNIREIGFKFVDINDHFQVSINIFGKPLNSDHEIFKSQRFKSNLKTMNELLEFLSYLDTFQTCLGNRENCILELDRCDVETKSHYLNDLTNAIHSNDCLSIFKDWEISSKCQKCSRLSKYMARVIKNKKQGNLRYLSKKEQLKLLRQSRIENKQLKTTVKRLRKKCKQLFESQRQAIGEEIFGEIVEENPFCTKENFYRLMMKQQFQLLKNKKKRPQKWHKSIIQWCSFVRAKSAAAYDAFRHVIPLPSPPTLYNYVTTFSAKSGFTKEAIVEMKNKIDLESVCEHQQYFSIMVDEMKIKDDLVYKASTGDVVGFCHLNDVGEKLKAEETKKTGENCSDPPLATHVMALMVRGITTNFKHVLAYFPCSDMKAEELYSIMQESIEVMENNGFKVLTIICDKSGINQKFIKMSTCYDEEKGVGYKGKNPYAPRSDPRYIYYISDPPHLIKTVRNSLFDSGSSTKDRMLKKNGKHILWSHVVQMFRKDCSSHLRLCPKLTNEHIALGPFYKMRVKYATQVLSASVASAMEQLVGEEASETVKFIRIFNKMFDIFNTRNLAQGKSKRNPNLEPFTSLTDSRFEWLEKEFLGYLREWSSEVEQTTFSKEGKQLMMLSAPSLNGLHITVNSISEVTKFLLSKGATFVLTNRFNQDPLEQHFGKHRRAIGSHENPDLLTFGFSERKFKIMRPLIVKSKRGNTQKLKKN